MHGVIGGPRGGQGGHLCGGLRHADGAPAGDIGQPRVQPLLEVLGGEEGRVQPSTLVASAVPAAQFGARWTASMTVGTK